MRTITVLILGGCVALCFGGCGPSQRSNARQEHDRLEGSDESLIQCRSPGTRLSVMVERDARVAYAYILLGEDIVGDVWLYNVRAPPQQVAWDDPSQMPFLNPREYVVRLAPPPPNAVVECMWKGRNAEILIDGILYARLEPGSKPGWSKMASKDGPLALRLDGL